MLLINLAVLRFGGRLTSYAIHVHVMYFTLFMYFIQHSTVPREYESSLTFHIKSVSLCALKT
jgi:hypothetical protein